MTFTRTNTSRMTNWISAGALAAVLGLSPGVPPLFSLIGITATYAQDAGHTSGGDGSGSGGAGGSGSGQQGQSGAGTGAGGSGQAGPSDNGKGPQAGGGEDQEESDGRGPQYNQPSGGQGGKPVWAQEGIPEVDLGRLSVIRSPDKVLDQALAEAIAGFNPATEATLYSGTAADFAAQVSDNWDTITFIDAPLQNLALLKEYWSTGSTSLSGVTPASSIEFAAILIGTASDKEIKVTPDTVIALATIVGVVLPSADVQTIAEQADAVRATILAAHG